MGGTCSTQQEMTNTYKIMIEDSQGRDESGDIDTCPIQRHALFVKRVMSAESCRGPL